MIAYAKGRKHRMNKPRRNSPVRIAAMTKPKTIVGQFVPHRLEMLQSLAWRSLSGTARRVLDRFEIEHMKHAGQKKRPPNLHV